MPLITSSRYHAPNWLRNGHTMTIFAHLKRKLVYARLRGLGNLMIWCFESLQQQLKGYTRRRYAKAYAEMCAGYKWP